MNPNGTYVVAVKTGSGDSFSANGLPAAKYGIRYTTGAGYDLDVPKTTIESGEDVEDAIPAGGALTGYRIPQVSAAPMWRHP